MAEHNEPVRLFFDEESAAELRAEVRAAVAAFRILDKERGES
ncbi:MAG TPA: hypothetical protein VIP77_19145 [Jiangellaceae bacterium]